MSNNQSFWARTLKTLGLHRKDLRAWAYYDIANSSFAVIIMVAILPVYFADVVAKELPANERTALWAYISSFALLVTALASPILGTISDWIRGKKKFLLYLTVSGALSSAALAFSGEGLISLTAILYILANISFALGNVFYEAMLVDLCDEDEVHVTSTSAYALGYIASAVILALNLSWVMSPATFGFTDADAAIKASFVSVGIWWIVFSIPLFKHVKEPEPRVRRSNVGGGVVKESLVQLYHTLRDSRQFPNLFIFLIGFWFYSDGIGTIIKLATVYGKEVGISNDHLIAAVLMIQVVGVPSSFIFGPLAMKIGPKNGLYITLVIYTVLTIGSYWMTTALHFWVLAIGVALVQGASQALSRSIYALMVPKHRASEFFGFFSVSSKFAGILGPLMFGVISQLTGGSRNSLIFICLLFVVGIFCLTKVDIQKAQQEALADKGV
ncbi:MFS transporter [Pseudobacteriovorax antillogorgiicola]|uniref:MFS transporter, UMF1 family n=1 Tax=Pseudobacteriovorax antillogorgiicola TaxID=1513793 RepID=A0A1Y6BB31_9BACT|nr:MFS transporter [Pseudobacteriovorax antillogorgiicola]TCS58860.1 UMF1 family MFS transporter [Pseudobacteriovorax antillogorgiicola]SME93955.1 MFS transporter, UMF1 family [Pseudobacteriovorax antillogorgiicola]